MSGSSPTWRTAYRACRQTPDVPATPSIGTFPSRPRGRAGFATRPRRPIGRLCVRSRPWSPSRRGTLWPPMRFRGSPTGWSRSLPPGRVPSASRSSSTSSPVGRAPESSCRCSRGPVRQHRPRRPRGRGVGPEHTVVARTPRPRAVALGPVAARVRRRVGGVGALVRAPGRAGLELLMAAFAAARDLVPPASGSMSGSRTSWPTPAPVSRRCWT